MPNTMMELRAMESQTFRFDVHATIDETPVEMTLPAPGQDPCDAETLLRRALARTGYEDIAVARAGPITEGDDRR